MITTTKGIDLAETLAYRERIHSVLDRDPAARGIFFEAWRNDPVAFINDCFWTYDPRSLQVFPFVLFPIQEQFIRWLEEREAAKEDGLLEKSRDMGATWCCVAFAVHRWRFRDNYKATFASRKVDLVDKSEDPDCIFEKIRAGIDYLPAWLLPKGYDPRLHNSRMLLKNVENNSVITGEGGSQIGRGGRGTMYFVDEAAYLEQPTKAEAAMSFSAECKIYVSTPNGPGNPFYRRRFSGKTPVFTMHWRDDPRKDDAWYEDKKASMDPVDVAREIDIDYSESAEDTLIPMIWARAAVGFPLKPGLQKVCALDVAEFGSAVNALVTCRSPVLDSIRTWTGRDTTQTAREAKRHAEEVNAHQLRYDAGGVGAGVTGTLRNEPPSMLVIPINFGQAATNTIYDNKRGDEKFRNLRAEMWWEMRRRLQKTWEVREHGREYPEEELISFPTGDPLTEQLLQQLTIPKYRNLENGRIEIESKEKMTTRGVRSPDLADALVMAFSSAFLRYGGGQVGLGARGLPAEKEFW